MKKDYFLFFVILSISLQLNANQTSTEAASVVEYKKINYQINGRYKGGEYLIYDCEGEYYACVDKDGSDQCRLKREESQNKKEARLSCAPLKKFEDKKTCLQKNYEVLESLALRRFCFPK